MAGVFKKNQFFIYFLLPVFKTFIMCITYIGKNSYGWLYNFFKFFHLSRHRNSCLKYGQIIVSMDIQNADRNSYLRVKTFGASYDRVFIFQQLIKPFFHYRFSIASGNTDYRETVFKKLIPMISC